MELNIYTERKTPFDLNVFKKTMQLFLARNNIHSINYSENFEKIKNVYKEIISESLLSDSLTEEKLPQLINDFFNNLEKIEKSEIFENLEEEEKSVISCLLDFTKQYVKMLKNNNFYYEDQFFSLENSLILLDVQELFNFSKIYFSLMLSNKKLSFDDCIKKELKSFNEEFGFKNFFFRKPITISEKINLLKNIEILKNVLNEISSDLDLSKNQLSINGMISISLEPNILGYSSTSAYMNRKEDNYIISLGKYKNDQELKECFIHEWAHCIDYSYEGERKSKSKNWTHSVDAIYNIVHGREENSEIEELMSKFLGLENYFFKFRDIKNNMIKDFHNEILPLFNIDYEINIFEKNPDMFHLLISNYFKINTVEMITCLVYSTCLEENKIADYLRIKNDDNFKKENNQELFLKIDQKIESLRHKYNYVESVNIGFFVDEKFHDLLMHDFFEKKHYYLKPTEIMARSFELIYKNNSSLGYTHLSDEEKETHKMLIKNMVNKIIPKNEVNLKKAMK